MKKKYFRQIFIGFVFIVLSAGCRKEVQIGSPVTQLAISTVFTDNGTATAAVLSVYAQLLTNIYTLHRATALSADELTNFATDQNSVDLYRNGLTGYVDGNAIGIWQLWYNLIYQENAVLENLESSTAVNVKVKQQLTGEAYFMRGYFYFYLVNLYGDVPLVTSTDYKLNATLPRSPKSSVYQQIVNDLKKAQATLNINYVDVSDTAKSSDHVRPNSSAATALLSRVYLYKGNYDSAENQATAVISNTAYSLPASLSKVFLKNSTEAIWQLLTGSEYNATYDGIGFSLTASPGSSTNNSATISPQLYNSFEPGDNRTTTWINSYTDGVNTWYYPYKYRDDLDATATTEYTMMLRLAEQYLIRAEARAQQGNTAGSVSDLNIIRSRAGLGSYSGLVDKASLLAAIGHERQVELFTEGDRWLDLQRTKSIDSVMGGATGACAAKGGTWSSYQQLYPIPLTDIQNNSNLNQTSGY